MTAGRTVRVFTGMDIAYATYGAETDPPLLMIHGFGVQLTGWNPELLRMLTDRGLRLVVFDNRDVGLSTHIDAAGPIDPMAVVLRQLPSVPYLLSDMAADTVGLMDELGLASAHVLGVSLGGMIAQQLAIDHPERVRSLTSMLSTPDIGIAEAQPRAAQALLSPVAATREGAMDRSAAIAAVIGSQVYERDEVWARAASGLAWDRNNDATGVGRQFAAIRYSPDRRPGLAGLRVPSLVIHGEVDPLIPVAGGLATAQAIPGAELIVVPGMAHDIPRAVWTEVVDAVAGLVHRAEAFHDDGAQQDGGAEQDAQRGRSHPATHGHTRWGRLAREDKGERA